MTPGLEASDTPEKLLHLIELVYATVTQPELWKSVITEISSTLEGESIAIYATFPESHTPDLLTMNSMAEAAWVPFAEHYAAINPIMSRAEAKFFPGTTWFSQDAILNAELERTEFYTDFYAPNDMHHTVGLRIPLWGAAAGSLSCQRPKRAGAFGPEADYVIQALKPHLQRALALGQRMTLLESQAQGLGAALSAFDHGVLCLGFEGRVVFANAAAEALLRGQNGLSLLGGRLRATDAAADTPLQRIVRAALGLGIEGDASTPAPAALLVNREGRRPLRVSVAPYRSAGSGLGEPVLALVFLYDLNRRPVSRSQLMTTLYALTATEARVAEHLAAGLEVRELAASLGMALETARFHVKRVLAKTGARKQTELMRLILTLPGA